MSEQLKTIGLNTWITIIILLLTVGMNYGILQTNLSIIESKISRIEKTVESGSIDQKTVLSIVSEQNRKIDKNESEIKHLREIQKIEKYK